MIFNDWQTPKWHPDWGDPKLDISLFKSLATALLDLSSDFHFELDPVEEGYLSLQVQYKGDQILEAQLVDRSKGTLGIFLDSGSEVYITDPLEIVKYVEKYLSDDTTSCQ